MVRTYKVAECAFSVEIPEDCDIDALLPSFADFRCRTREMPMFVLCIMSGLTGNLVEGATLLEKSDSDMGHTALYALPDSYVFTVRFSRNGPTHIMQAGKEFRNAKASIDWTDSEAGEVLSSMLRMMFAQAVLLQDGISIHSSTVVKDGKAWMFMGKSGTGKSTHSRLWKQVCPDCELLNDDNPVIRLMPEGVIAYGSPWSGKTPCYKNVSAPVGGIVRLSQAPHNRFLPQEDVDAFMTVLPGCSGIRTDAKLNDALCDTLAKIVETVKVAQLECLPDTDAAILCCTSFRACVTPHSGLDPESPRMGKKMK